MKNVLIASNGKKTFVMIDGKPVHGVTSLSFETDAAEFADLKIEIGFQSNVREFTLKECAEEINEILGKKLCAE